MLFQICNGVRSKTPQNREGKKQQLFIFRKETATYFLPLSIFCHLRIFSDIISCCYEQRYFLLFEGYCLKAMQKCRSDAIPSATFRLRFHFYGEQDGGLRDAAFLPADFWQTSPQFLGNVPGVSKKTPDLIVLLAEEKKLQYELPCCPTPVSDNRCNSLMEKDLLRV